MVSLVLFLLEKLGSERALNGVIVLWCALLLGILVLLILVGLGYYQNIYQPTLFPTPHPVEYRMLYA